MASRGINKVILIGNLGQDPEVRHMNNGGTVVNLSLATSDIWRDKQTHEQKERTEWHRVVLFGKLAEISGEYLKKGAQIYLEGRLQTRKWQDQAGQERYTTEVVVDSVNGVLQMLGGRVPSSVDTDPRLVLVQKPNTPLDRPQVTSNPPPIDFGDVPF